MSDTTYVDTIEIDDWVLTGCACPACAASRGDTVDAADLSEQTATSGGYSVDYDTTDADQAVDALLGGIAWNTTSLTFSFPDSSDDFSYNWSGEQNGFGAFNSAQADAARDALDIFASVSGLTFTELTGEADRDADLTFAESSYAGTAYAYFPSSGDWGGDSWFNTRHFNNPEVGTYGWSTFLHEIGHAVGLKHGHETYGAGALPFEMDSHEYSLMTYRSFVGSSGSYYSNEAYGGPQTLMMLDTAAVQAIYGANFAHNSGDTIYAFDPETGQMLVDGEIAVTPGANRILRTIWDGDGEDTYDLSAYDSDLAIDLSPGGHVDLDVGGLAQRSRLGAGEYAKGHVFNALQYEGDERSLIENAVAGAGDDTLFGNQAANRLVGGAGDDVLAGGAGNDVLIGGEGFDIAVFDGVFSDFVVTFVEGALEVLGDGLDRVLSSIETLRFDDLEAAFADFALAPEPEDEAPPETEGAGEDQPADPEAEPTEEAVGGDPEAGDDTQPDLDDPSEPEGDEPTDPPTEPEDDEPSDPPEDPDEPSEPEGDEPVEEPPVDEPEEPGIEEPVAEDPVTTDREPEEPSADEPVEDEPAEEEPEQDDTEDDGRRVPVADDPLSDADETDDLEPPEETEPEDDVPPDLTPDTPDDDTPDDPQPDDRLPEPKGGEEDEDVVMLGEARADDLTGGKGDDTLSGAGGEDTLRGGDGEDNLSGDAGDDLLLGGGENDRLSGGGGADRLKGGAGDDLLMGGRAADTLNGGSGDDDIEGGGGRDRLVGRSGDDRLSGGGGADTLRGNAGDDSLEGGFGRDVMSGGGGVDSFLFDDRFGRDRITDFDADREVLDFSEHSRVNSFNDLEIAQGGAGAVITDGAGGRILLLDVDIGDIDEGDFLF